MVKKKKLGGGKRYKKGGVELPQDVRGDDKPRGGPAPPAHVQRKVSRKVQFLQKVAQTNLALRKDQGGVQKKSRKGRKPLPDLSTLADTLNDILTSGDMAGKASGGTGQTRVPGASVKSNKERAAITLKETERLQRVLHHPQYQSNPLLAIANHLNATLPPPPTKVLPGGPKNKGKAEKKKKKKKTSSLIQGAAAMED